MSRDANDGSHKRSPFAAVQRRSWGIDFDTPIFLTISCKSAAVIDRKRRCRRDEAFKAAQQALLIALDLNDQVIAGVAGDLKSFFDSAWRRA